MITHARFRLFEAALLRLLSPAAAALLCDIVAAKLEGPPPDAPPGRASLLEGGISFALGSWAMQKGISLDQAIAELTDINVEIQTCLSFSLVPGPRLRRLGSGAETETTIDLSRSFRSLLDGLALTGQKNGGSLSLRPDGATRKGLDLINAAAASEAALRFLWRIAAPPDSATAKLELARLAHDLKRLAGESSVVLANSGAMPDAETFGPASTLLSALLHLDTSAVLILPISDACVMQAIPVADDEDDDSGFRGPSDERPTAQYRLAASASAFLRILSSLPFTAVLAVPEKTILAPEVAALFAGACGPHRLDRAGALADLKSQSPQCILGDRQAALVLRASGDPAFATEILRGAKAIAKANADARIAWTGRAGDKPSSNAAVITQAPRHRRARTAASAFDQLYNGAAEDLASSMLAHVMGPAALRDESTAVFDPDLFCSDPDPSFLFDRAPILRETGVRILLTGPTGTGKSALVSELARRMGLEIKQYSGASLFARPWGATEKNIGAAAAQSRGYLAFYDEADSLMGNRFSGSDNNRHLTVCATNAFLAAYQDAVPGSPVVAATNRIDDIDPAVRRRFDIILTTTVLPDSKERIAWDRLLKMAPPSGWTPAGDTVPGDYIKAARQLELLGNQDPIMAAAAVIRARDDRAVEGVTTTKKNPVGFTSPVHHSS